MPPQEPTLPEIEGSISQLLGDEKVLALSTIDANGHPSSSYMHYTADGLRVYMHTFVYTRKHTEILKDSRVSYAVHDSNVRSYADRFKERSLQMKGHASVVVDADEIAHAAQISRAKSSQGAETAIYDNVKPPEQNGQQLFLRIDPVEALWADHRISLMWRRIVSFSPEGRVVGTHSYQEAVGRRQAR